VGGQIVQVALRDAVVQPADLFVDRRECFDQAPLGAGPAVQRLALQRGRHLLIAVDQLGQLLAHQTPDLHRLEQLRVETAQLRRERLEPQRNRVEPGLRRRRQRWAVVLEPARRARRELAQIGALDRATARAPAIREVQDRRPRRDDR
jgi:hypothetical protein